MKNLEMKHTKAAQQEWLSPTFWQLVKQIRFW